MNRVSTSRTPRLVGALFLIVSILYTAGLLAGCVGGPTLGASGSATTGGTRDHQGAAAGAASLGGSGYSGVEEVAELQAAIVTSARSLVGVRRLRIDGRTYRSDCSGTILAVYANAGVVLDDEFARAEGNGVRRLYAISREAAVSRRAVLPPEPAVGDIVFWDNTYDRNENGRWDDELTHAGIIVSVDPDGTIEYLHYHYRNGIVVQQMNLDRSDEVALNDAMRMRSQRDTRPDLWLASHLYRSTGSPYLIALD